jgi:hypothetical protein
LDMPAVLSSTGSRQGHDRSGRADMAFVAE